jgi:hypothetical protein
MQHPSFSQQMLENLLQFDSLLDQYELAALYGQGEALQAGLIPQSQPEALELLCSNYTQASCGETPHGSRGRTGV